MHPFTRLLPCLWLAAATGLAQAPATRPNIIFILADDLGQGQLGCYGQKLIQTPRLDRMAAEGTRFTQAYTGTAVCAPSRASLMTGLHMGHCPIRANRETKPDGQMPLPEKIPTVAQILKDAGYATACTGKWGLGMWDTPGSPLKKGFDFFYGYNCQRHAHSYFPEFLWRNDRKEALDGKTYSQNLIQKEALGWVRANAAKPFFLYYAVTLPHAQLEIDDPGIYRDRPWTDKQKTLAAMITRLDHDVGELLDLLAELHIDDNTIVFFSGDNGSDFPAGSDMDKLFDQTGGLRGIKRSLYEGGLRQPSIVRWPGRVPVRVCDEPWAFWDFLPTATALAGATPPAGLKTDGLDLTAFLTGGPAPKRECFYWELHEGPPLQAVRFGDWKAVRKAPKGGVELYDLATDPGEKKDVSGARPKLVGKALDLFARNRTADPAWPVPPAWNAKPE
ncbi:MAG: arylsulfatase [Kiritimatiellia bacterium]